MILNNVTLCDFYCYNTLMNFINVRSFNQHAKFNVAFSVLSYSSANLCIFLVLKISYKNHDYLSCIITGNITWSFQCSFYTKSERCCCFIVEIHDFSAIVARCYDRDAIFYICFDIVVV